jgi:hypothetical protein
LVLFILFILWLMLFLMFFYLVQKLVTEPLVSVISDRSSPNSQLPTRPRFYRFSQNAVSF